ncbi:MurR/RpiR family transcriptional regulator [Bacillus sp. A301a_S52]|nr:MurR/RpiR family transcriptional regulator [Bacillus sp. A301a_S52]
MEQLMYTLLAYINNSLEKDINYSIAKSLLQNINKIKGYSLETVAEACNVAPSTINRFCKRIGFKNFSNLRHSVAISSKYEDPDTVLSSDKFQHQLAENITLIEDISKKTMDRVINKIHNAKRIVILGFEKHQVQAMELQKKLFQLGKFCECSTNLFKQIDALSDLTEEDLIITISIRGNILSDGFSVGDKITSAKGQKLLLTFMAETHDLVGFDEIMQCGKIANSSVSGYTLLRLFDVLVERYQHLYPY